MEISQSCDGIVLYFLLREVPAGMLLYYLLFNKYNNEIMVIFYATRHQSYPCAACMLIVAQYSAYIVNLFLLLLL